MNPLHAFLLATIAAILCILGGCDKRTKENAISAQVVRHAVQGAAKVLVSPEFTDPLVTMSEADRGKVLAAMRKIYTLLASADKSLEPVIARLSVGYKPAELVPPTTVEEAVADPEAFAKVAAGQAALARAEAEKAQADYDFVNWIKEIGVGIADSWLAKLGLGAGTLGLIVGGAAKLARVYNDNRKTIDSLRTAFHQTVSGLDNARGSMGDQTWNQYVAPALEAAQDQKVKELVVRVQKPATGSPA